MISAKDVWREIKKPETVKDDDPILKFEDIAETVRLRVEKGMFEEYDLLTDVVILFERNTMLTAKERRSISMETRILRSTKLNGELIHNAAIIAIGVEKERLLITKPRVLTHIEEQRIRSVSTLNKHIREDTVDLLTKANRKRIFKTETSLDKFEKYLALHKGILSRDAADRLGVSLSTINQFKKYEV